MINKDNNLVNIISTGMSKQSHFHFFAFYRKQTCFLAPNILLTEYPALVIFGINFLYPIFLIHFLAVLSKRCPDIIFYNYELRFLPFLLLCKIISLKSILMLEELTLFNNSLFSYPREMLRVLVFQASMHFYIMMCSHIIVPTNNFIDSLYLDISSSCVFTGFSR